MGDITPIPLGAILEGQGWKQVLNSTINPRRGYFVDEFWKPRFRASGFTFNYERRQLKWKLYLNYKRKKKV